MEALRGLVEDEADALAVVAIEAGIVQVVTELGRVAEVVFEAACGVEGQFCSEIFRGVAEQQ